MHLSVTFKNLDSSDYLKAYVQDKLDRLDKLLDHPGYADVVLRVEHQRRIAEINITSDRLGIHAKEENDNMHAAIDLVMDKIKKQLTKNKEKRRNRRTRDREVSENSPLTVG